MTPKYSGRDHELSLWERLEKPRNHIDLPPRVQVCIELIDEHDESVVWALAADGVQLQTPGILSRAWAAA
jgi:hypothetical protein